MYSKNLLSSTRNWASFEISLQTYRRRIYVWSNDVTLNHMPYVFLYVIILKRVSLWRVKTLSIVSSSPKLPRSFYEIWRETEAILKVMRGRERLILQVDGDFLLSWMQMAVSIGKGRYYKLFAGNSPPKRLLIEDINEPGLLSDEYVQGLCNTAWIKPTIDRIIPNFCHKCDLQGWCDRRFFKTGRSALALFVSFPSH